jgi:hypothetical protein
LGGAPNHAEQGVVIEKFGLRQNIARNRDELKIAPDDADYISATLVQLEPVV